MPPISLGSVVMEKIDVIHIKIAKCGDERKIIK